MAGKLWQRYGAHASLQGFYIPFELANQLLSDPQIDKLTSFYAGLSTVCKSPDKTNSKKVLWSPYFYVTCDGKLPAGYLDPAKMGMMYGKILAGAGIDIVAAQDSVGARGWKNMQPYLTDYYNGMAKACQGKGVQLWGNLESFVQFEQSDRRPAKFARLQQQIETATPLVERSITFDFFHYLYPPRGDAQTKLYADYKAYIEGQQH